MAESVSGRVRRRRTGRITTAPHPGRVLVGGHLLPRLGDDVRCSVFVGEPAARVPEGCKREARPSRRGFVRDDLKPSTECYDQNSLIDCDDYGLAATCGDGYCAYLTAGESCSSCPADCNGTRPSLTCGNTVCEFGESYRTCPADCIGMDGTGMGCGDGICAPDDTETCSDCL